MLSEFNRLQASEGKLSMAQEELAANRTHQTGLEAQIQEIKAGRCSLEQELAKRDQNLQKQEQTLKELQEQEVGDMFNTQTFKVHVT